LYAAYTAQGKDFELILSSPAHTSNNFEATFDFVATSGNNVERVS